MKLYFLCLLNLISTCLAPLLADAEPIDSFYETVSGQVNRKSGIYFQWYKTSPSLNAPLVDAKDLVIARGHEMIRLNVQLNDGGTDSASCTTAPGTKYSWQDDLSGKGIISWHETFNCQAIKVGASVQDLVVTLNIDVASSSIDVVSKSSSLRIHMDLQRK